MSMTVNGVSMPAAVEFGPEAFALLRRIVDAQTKFFDRNENGSHDEFQRAADEFHDAVDAAEVFLLDHGR
jgi:DNA-binding GntR family transcriptional regulator